MLAAALCGPRVVGGGRVWTRGCVRGGWVVLVMTMCSHQGTDTYTVQLKLAFSQGFCGVNSRATSGTGLGEHARRSRWRLSGNKAIDERLRPVSRLPCRWPFNGQSYVGQRESRPLHFWQRPVIYCNNIVAGTNLMAPPSGKWTF